MCRISVCVPKFQGVLLNASQTVILILSFIGIGVAFFIVGLLIQHARHNRAKEIIRISEEGYLTSLESSTDGLWDWNILLDRVQYSDRFRGIVGIPSAVFSETIAAFRERIHIEEVDAIW